MPTLKNPKHERFAQALTDGKSASDAYVLAGYKPSHSNASVLKATQKVSDRVSELLQERERIAGEATAEAIKATAISKQWVIERLIENVNRAMQVEPVLDRQGNPTGEYTYQGSVANRALELLGKEQGMFIERVENKATVNYVARLPEKSPDAETWLKQYAPKPPPTP